MSVTDVLRVAQGEIGYSRWADPEEGTKYGRWYAKTTGESWYGASGVAYCAMFVSWVYAQCPNDSIPGGMFAYVPYGINRARAAGAIVSFEQAVPGDLICFDWGGDGVADHVGIVEGYPSNGTIVTIEGNTSAGTTGSQSNGGGVYRRTRYKSQVCAIIRTSHSGSSPVTNSSPATTVNTYSEIMEVIKTMNATHILFEWGGFTCVADVLSGTWRKFQNGTEYQNTLTVLKRAGAKVKSWQELGAKSNHVDAPKAFGKQIL